MFPHVPFPHVASLNALSLHALSLHLLSYAALLAAGRVCMVMMGAWYCYWRQSPVPGPTSLRGFLRFLVPPKLWRQRCVRIDLSLVVLRKLTGAWGVVPVAASILLIAPVVYGGLAGVLGPHPQAAPSLAMNVAVVAALLLVHDFGEYVVHAASHRHRLLWEFHKAHHSIEFMTPISAKRAHFVDDLARMVVIGPLLGCSVGVLAYLLDMAPVESTLFGLDAYVIGNLLSFENLRHSHIPLSYGRAEALLMSPAQHQLHHNRSGSPRNYGSFLSFWDRAFGTFSPSAPPGSFEIGLNPAEQPHYDAVWKLYVRPFWNIGILARRSWIKRGIKRGRARARDAAAGMTPAMTAGAMLPASNAANT